MKRWSALLSAWGMLLLCSAAAAAPAHHDWTISHQADRFVDRVMMEAWAEADQGPARMTLYCDTESGFRVMISPHRPLMPEGPSLVTLTIDDAKPVTLMGDAFGDEDTDVVTVHDTDRIQAALSRARRVAVQFQGSAGPAGADAFSFGDLAAQRSLLMRVCPVK